MKKYLLVAVALLGTISIANAQDGFNYLMIKGGIGNKSSKNFSLALDFAGKYHSSFEISANYFSKDSEDYKNYFLGVNYKPLLVRNKNSMLKMRIGIYGGSDDKDFIFAPNLGLEFGQSLSPKVDLILSNDNNYFFEAKDNWRTNIQLGFRISI